MLGAATARKLRRFGIDTIGALANADPVFLTKALGKQGQMLWQYANGRGEAFLQAQPAANKGYGNAVTTSRDVTGSFPTPIRCCCLCARRSVRASAETNRLARA